MLTALVAHPPRFGATVATFDATEAKAVRGVTDVVTIPSGIAVLATDFWSATKGRDALRITWDESEAMTEGSEDLIAAFRGLTQEPGAVARQAGDPEQAEQTAERVLEAEFVFPYLAHAALEPMNCVLERTEDGGVQVYNGEQFQTVDQAAIAEVLGLEPAQVRITMLYAGGSFGRRANPHSDYLREAAHIFKAIEGRAPVKLMWTREDDMQAGYFRPLYVHRMRAGVDAAGQPVSWLHRIVGQSIMTGTVMESAQVKDGVDNTSVEGARNVPYDLPNLRVDLHSPQVPVPVQWWRAVGSTHTAFAVETFIDELAEAAGEDPVAFRLARLPDHPRHRGVLELAAEKAGWGKSPLPEGRGRGVAVHESFNSYVAQVVEVSVQDGAYRVDRVVLAVDCGVPVNPDIIKAQMEGGMGFGLSAVLKSEITLEEGRVQQSNFHDYTVLRLNEMPPAIEVHIVPSTEAPTGVGEPAVPVIAPAVANALYAITGQRHRRLPIRL
jgi:isoquinoline 1-oxidoreductase beta subunit